jgi:hypothetical protein
MSEKDRSRFIVPEKPKHPLGWNCSTCFHVVKDTTPNSKAMKCCRYPPRSEPAMQQGQIVGWMSISPPVTEGDWCGEWTHTN